MMDAEARRALLEHAIRLYGEPAQMDMAVEEMAELTKKPSAKSNGHRLAAK